MNFQIASVLFECLHAVESFCCRLAVLWFADVPPFCAALAPFFGSPPFFLLVDRWPSTLRPVRSSVVRPPSVPSLGSPALRCGRQIRGSGAGSLFGAGFTIVARHRLVPRRRWKLRIRGVHPPSVCCGVEVSRRVSGSVFQAAIFCACTSLRVLSPVRLSFRSASTTIFHYVVQAPRVREPLCFAP